MADQLSLFIASRYPEAVLSNFNFLVSGFESEIYTFQLQFPRSSCQNYILRLFTGEGAREKVVREARGLSLLQKAGYPVPTLLLQEAKPGILGKPFEIIEKLVLASAESHQQGQLLSRFGSLLAQLHKLDWRLFTADPDVYEKNPIRLLDAFERSLDLLYRN